MIKPHYHYDKSEHTKEESFVVTDHINQLVGWLDDKSIKDLFSVCDNDLSKVWDLLYKETYKVLYLQDNGINTSELNYLPNLKDGYEDYLRTVNLSYFVSSVLPDFELNWHCLEWFNMIQMYQYLCVMAARDHSKSYSFSFASLLWKMYRYRKGTETYTPPMDVKLCKEGMLITNEYKLAKRLLKKVKREIEENPILYDRLCPGKSAEGWANESLMCKNGAELTLSSYRSPNRGPHPGYIVVDDFLDKSCLYSQEARDRFIEVFQAEIMNMILPQGQVTVVGTPFHQQDLYSHLKKDPSWQVFEYPAIFPDGRVLWESRYSYKDLLKKRRSLGNLIFSREILVRPISDSISIFPWDVLELSFINMHNISLSPNRNSYPVKMKRVSVGCDFALSGAANADYSAFTVWGLDNLNQVHLMWLVHLHGSSYNEQLAHLTQLHRDFQPDIFVMEVNGFQRVMAQMAKDRGIPNIIEFNTNGFNKKDMYEGLPSLAVMFETGTIKMPRGNEESKAKTDMVCNELNSMAFDQDSGKLESVAGHDDLSMSMYFGIEGLKRINTGLRIRYIE